MEALGGASLSVSGMTLLLGMSSVFPCSINIVSSANVNGRASPSSGIEDGGDRSMVTVRFWESTIF